MSKSKAKGTRAETKVRRFLEERCPSIRVTRRALSGKDDQGDLLVEFPLERNYSPYVIEVKAGKQTANPSRAQLAEWLRQAAVEADNASDGDVVAAPALVVVRYNRKLADADVYFPCSWTDSTTHMYLDQFARRLG